ALVWGLSTPGRRANTRDALGSQLRKAEDACITRAEASALFNVFTRTFASRREALETSSCLHMGHTIECSPMRSQGTTSLALEKMITDTRGTGPGVSRRDGAVGWKSAGDASGRVGWKTGRRCDAHRGQTPRASGAGASRANYRGCPDATDQAQ